MQVRPDISDKLIHFTSGDNEEDAFLRLCRIIHEQRLIGGNNKIRGSYRCVCFTEAPSHSLAHGFVNLAGFSRYSSFGVLFDKSWLYQQGGRPVIYQSDPEFSQLPDDLRWRHVRYEPGVADFTWEREWRIHCEALTFDPCTAVVIVPCEKWASMLFQEHEIEQDFEVLRYSQILDEDIAEQYRNPFPWRMTILNV
jgi:hypothetical protein